MKPKTEILIKYSELVGKYPLKKIFEYLNTLQKTGITNMFGATPYLYGGREWIQKQIDYFDIEEDENVEKLLDMSDEIKDSIISGALKRQEREETNDFIRSVERRVQQESKDILKIWMDFKGKVLKESIYFKKMKKYIITETQLKKLLLEEKNSIKKGIALKIDDENGEYYKSIIKEFTSNDDYKNWKNNLEPNIEIIGDIDIEQNETLEESEKKNPIISESESKRVDAGKKLLLKHIKMEYPFVIDINIEYKKKLATFGYVTFKINLNKFYDFYNVTPPKDYEKFDFLLPQLENEGLYLSRYVDDEYKNDFGYEYNRDLENYMNEFYMRLPENMRYYKFEDYSDEDFETDEYKSRDLDFYKRWQNERQPLELKTDIFIPVVDLEKIKF
jgi:hypothetical protein